MSEKCPCCSGKQYSLCCEPFLKGNQIPASAEQLMRSRYSAYVMQDADYLIATWHPARREPKLAGLLSESFQDTEWLSLNVTRCNHGCHDNEAFVTFFARYREKRTFMLSMSVRAFFARINAGTMLMEQRRQWGATIVAPVAPRKNTRNVAAERIASTTVLPLML